MFAITMYGVGTVVPKTRYGAEAGPNVDDTTAPSGFPELSARVIEPMRVKLDSCTFTTIAGTEFEAAYRNVAPVPITRVEIDPSVV